jgi:hypothetical protein
MMSKIKQLERAIKSKDKELAVKLVKEVKGEVKKNLAKSQKLCDDIAALNEKLQRS